MSRTIDTREVATLVRKELKKNFGKGVKFSVRIDRYSMGSSVDISWSDGPTESRVREIVAPFCGGRFEGMSDCTYSADQWYCPEHGAVTAEEYGGDKFCDTGVRSSRCCAKAELVHFANTSLGVIRHLSPETLDMLTAAVALDLGIEIEKYEGNKFLPEADDYLATLVWRASIEFAC
jgi:hypothetical protein